MLQTFFSIQISRSRDIFLNKTSQRNQMNPEKFLSYTALSAQPPCLAGLSLLRSRVTFDFNSLFILFCCHTHILEDQSNCFQDVSGTTYQFLRESLATFGSL